MRGQSTRTLLVTRPQPQADEWVQALKAQGVGAAALPLLALQPVADAQPLRQAWAALLGPQPPALVMFVSGGAVGQFMVQRPAGAAWPSAVWAAATGPGTAAALRSAGVPQAALVQPRADAPSLDSEALWAELQSHDWAGRRVLLVRGVGGRDWLQRQWQAAGAEVAAVEAYRRVPAPWSHAEQARAQAAWSAPEEHAWLFSSAQALAVLMSSTSTGAPGSGGLGLPAQGSMPRAAIATHPRIAAAAQAAGFQPLLVAKPTVGAVAQALREPTLHEPTLREPTLHGPEARSLQSRAS